MTLQEAIKRIEERAERTGSLTIWRELDKVLHILSQVDEAPARETGD